MNPPTEPTLLAEFISAIVTLSAVVGSVVLLGWLMRRRPVPHRVAADRQQADGQPQDLEVLRAQLRIATSTLDRIGTPPGLRDPP